MFWLASREYNLKKRKNTINTATRKTRFLAHAPVCHSGMGEPQLRTMSPAPTKKQMNKQKKTWTFFFSLPNSNYDTPFQYLAKTLFFRVKSQDVQVSSQIKKKTTVYIHFWFYFCFWEPAFILPPPGGPELHEWALLENVRDWINEKSVVWYDSIFFYVWMLEEFSDDEEGSSIRFFARILDLDRGSSWYMMGLLRNMKLVT
jgi:hypothetical protein